jgi:excisionase family DNA binding protein
MDGVREGASGARAVSDALLDVAQTCEYLGGIGRSTLYRAVQRGRLRIVKVEGSTRFRRSELDRYLKARELAA